jgi:hypothetical protein
MVNAPRALRATVVNEHDELGPDLVPDYMTSVKPGAFCGWPYSYWGPHEGQRVRPQQPDLVKSAIPPRRLRQRRPPHRVPRMPPTKRADVAAKKPAKPSSGRTWFPTT